MMPDPNNLPAAIASELASALAWLPKLSDDELDELGAYLYGQAKAHPSALVSAATEVLRVIVTSSENY